MVDDVGMTGVPTAQAGNETDRDTALEGIDSAGDFQCPDGDTDLSGSRPVDVVIALDNSANMEDEVLMVQAAINPFANQLAVYGVDLHIALITAMAPSDDKADKNGICVDAPLGSGTCPEDSAPPGFVHVPQPVASRDALGLIVSTSDQWKTVLREDSVIHFLVVSDDDAEDSEAIFREGLAGLDPPIDAFVFHAFAPMTDKNTACDATPPLACCDYAAHEGVVYKALVSSTGGTFEDLCLQSFLTGFANLAVDIAEKNCPGSDVV